MENQRLSCVYCGNPRPNILKEVQNGTNTGFSLRGLLSRSRQRRQVIEPTPLVDCMICGHKYYLCGIQNDRAFINEFLENHVSLTENVIDTMNSLGIPLEYLGDLVVGITKPERSRSQLHIVIYHSSRRYFITCEKFEGGYLALNIEKVVVE